MKITMLLACLGLLSMSNSFAHEGHDHEGMDNAETLRQVKQGKLCLAKKQGYSLGAIIEKEGKTYRCVKAYSQDLIAQPQLVWVEVILKNKALITAPQ